MSSEKPSDVAEHNAWVQSMQDDVDFEPLPVITALSGRTARCG